MRRSKLARVTAFHPSGLRAISFHPFFGQAFGRFLVSLVVVRLFVVGGVCGCLFAFGFRRGGVGRFSSGCVWRVCGVGVHTVLVVKRDVILMHCDMLQNAGILLAKCFSVYVP